MTRYTPATDDDRRAMLAAIGVDSVDALFSDVPAGVRLDRPLDLPPGRSELEVYEYLRALAALNVSAEDELCFLGAGMYDHHVPAIVEAITSRSEFLTPYTPYQAEISQGTLQVMFEYQTAISELTGLPVSNASVYDGPSALASAGYLARLDSDRRRFLVSRGVSPQAREALVTSSAGWGTVVEEVDLVDGATEAEALAAALGDDVAAVFLAQPNFLGAVEDLEPLVQAARAAGALTVLSCDPIALGVLRTPGELGVDVAVGEGQPLGNRLDFGGPSFGFFAAREEHLRRLPGRIAGETVDADGRRGFVLTLQTREQHIRREKATHNICTAQALNALAAVIHLSWLGREGFVELAESLVQRTAYARERLSAIPGIEVLHEQPVVREFAVSLDAPVESVIERCAQAGVNPGHPLAGDYPELGNGLLVAITERRTRADIDRLAEVLADAVAAERTVRRPEVAA